MREFSVTKLFAAASLTSSQHGFCHDQCTTAVLVFCYDIGLLGPKWATLDSPEVYIVPPYVYDNF
jgi:hypothetical protein